MADNNNIGLVGGLDQSLTQLPQKEARKKDEIGRDEFITLLVTQLKNQDPLNPMENDRFAVDLAQFNSLSELMEINKKLDKTPTGTDTASLAQYLGTEVKINSKDIEVKDGDGGGLTFKLQGDANVEIQLLDASGAVVSSFDAGAMEKGRQSISLVDLGIADGKYGVNVVATPTGGGAQYNPEAFVAGIVTGFIPGANPILLMGEREVSPSDILEVNIPRYVEQGGNG